MAEDFAGFPQDCLRFLLELRKNNNRDWFQENKQRYEQLVREPALSFITAMQKPLRRLSKHFVADPKKSGGSLMRVYRDTRFATDKTPYKTNVGIQFRHEQGKDVHAPGFYVHIEPGQVFLAAGIWHPDSATLRAIRQHLDQHQAGWKRIVRQEEFASTFDLQGDSLKRPPRGFDAEHPLIEDLKRKDFIAVCEVPDALIFDSRWAEIVFDTFKPAKPLMRYLCQAIELPF